MNNIPSKDFYSEEYEQALIACLLIDNSVIDLVQGMLSEDAFYCSKYKLLFKTILADFAENGISNILSLKDRLPKFDPVVLAEITSSIPSAANWDFYANKIKQFYIARQLRSKLKEKLGLLTPENTIDTLQDLDSSLTSYMSYENGKTTAKDLMPQLVEMMQKNMKNKSPYLGFHTGFKNLSDILDGIQPENLYIVGARPSVGKTAFAVQLAANLCEEGVGVEIFSLEMSAVSLGTRLVAFKSGIPISHIKHGWVAHSQANLTKLNIAMDKIFDYNLSIYDRDISDEKELVSRIRVDAKKGLKVFILDHLGLLSCSNTSLKRNEQVGIITKKLQRLARELKIVVIVLCQLNRAAEGKPPSLADLKDSGTIEENSDIVMFIHRARAIGNEIEIPTDLTVVKNRDGKCGTAKMNFVPSMTKFEEVKDKKEI